MPYTTTALRRMTAADVRSLAVNEFGMTEAGLEGANKEAVIQAIIGVQVERMRAAAQAEVQEQTVEGPVLEDMTAVQLREVARELGAATHGTKAQLIARINAWHAAREAAEAQEDEQDAEALEQEAAEATPLPEADAPGEFELRVHEGTTIWPTDQPNVWTMRRASDNQVMATCTRHGRRQWMAVDPEGNPFGPASWGFWASLWFIGRDLLRLEAQREAA